MRTAAFTLLLAVPAHTNRLWHCRSDDTYSTKAGSRVPLLRRKFWISVMCLAPLFVGFASIPAVAQAVSVICSGASPTPFCSAVPGSRTEGWIPQTRSETMGQHGIVATSTSLGAQAGLRVLQEGGNAVDAAVAMASTLGVVEPFDVGPGADLFPLIYIAKTNTVYQLTDGGVAPTGATLQHYNSLGYFWNPANWGPGSGMPPGILASTVPAAIWGWDEVVRKFGNLTLKEDLQTAIGLAENGFPIQEVDASSWHLPNAVSCHPANAANPNGYCDSPDPDSVAVWYPNGVPPVAGQIFKNPDMATTLSLVAQYGRDVFYKGPIAQAIVAKSTKLGGTMTLQDLANYHGEWVTPAHGTYEGFDIYETTAPSQSWGVIEELNILEQCVPTWYPGQTLATLGPTSALFWHAELLAKTLAYDDLYAYNADPDFVSVPLNTLLSKSYAAGLCGKVNPNAAYTPVPGGNIDPPRAYTPPAGVYIAQTGDTIYGAVADQWGNMVSWINSNYSGFGSGVTIPGYGFVLCNRLQLFTLDPTSPNLIAPHKRPYQTISASFVVKDGVPLMVHGMPGGSQQAQGNMQVLVNILDLGANTQAGLDMARFTHDEVSGMLGLEPNLCNLVGAQLKAMGWNVSTCGGSVGVGGGQAVMMLPDPTDPSNGFYYRAGSNFRQDGQAVAY
ncbi:MAG: gamma-glutamyltransferase family protein [Acetobacteraceae bacterium]|nr:gamma-glutamyltransferase family protein [Acetobacteraceae bacterium]